MEPSKKSAWFYVAKAFQVGWDVAGGLLVGVLTGIALDKLCHTRVLFLFILSLWGIIHGFFVMIHIGARNDQK